MSLQPDNCCIAETYLNNRTSILLWKLVSYLKWRESSNEYKMCKPLRGTEVQNVQAVEVLNLGPLASKIMEGS